MSDLYFDIIPFDELPGTALIVAEGAIDATSVIAFEAKLKQLQQDGYSNFVLDMAGIKYVNSTGLGSLVTTADNLEKVGGGLALVKVHPKVRVVFDMLGLNTFFKIFTSQDEAVEFLRTRGEGGDEDYDVEAPIPAYSAPPPTYAPPAPPPRAAQPRPAPPPAYPPAASPQPAYSGYGAPPPAPPGYAPPAAPYQQPAYPSPYPPAPFPAQAPGFVPPTPQNPQMASCPACATSFKVTQTGRYKCPSCSVAFVIDPVFGVELAPATSQLTLSFTPECREGLALFLNAMVRRAGYGDQDFHQIKAAVEEIVEGLLRHTYRGQVFETFAVAFLPARHNLQMKIIANGPAMAGNTAALFPYASSVFGKIEVRPHPKGGSVLVASVKR